ADVEIAAVNPALQDRKEPLNRIGVRLDPIGQLARPFFFAVVDRIMAGEAMADPAIGAQLVSHQPAFGVSAADNDVAEGRCGDVLDLAGSRPTAALNESNNGNAITGAAHLLPSGRMQGPSRAA